MLPQAIVPAMQGVVPSVVVSCSLDGEPNATIISQVYYVDQTRVALSYQFFNKTILNVRENPFVSAIVIHPETNQQWNLALSYQFFNKTILNVRENPFVSAIVIHPETNQQPRFAIRSLRDRGSGLRRNGHEDRGHRIDDRYERRLQVARGRYLQGTSKNW